MCEVSLIMLDCWLRDILASLTILKLAYEYNILYQCIQACVPLCNPKGWALLSTSKVGIKGKRPSIF